MVDILDITNFTSKSKPDTQGFKARLSIQPTDVMMILKLKRNLGWKEWLKLSSYSSETNFKFLILCLSFGS